MAKLIIFKFSHLFNVAKCAPISQSLGTKTFALASIFAVQPYSLNRFVHPNITMSSAEIQCFTIDCNLPQTQPPVKPKFDLYCHYFSIRNSNKLQSVATGFGYRLSLFWRRMQIRMRYSKVSCGV